MGMVSNTFYVNVLRSVTYCLEVELQRLDTSRSHPEINDFKSSVSNGMWLTIGDETSEMVVKMDIQPETDPADVFDSVGKVIQWRNAYVFDPESCGL